MKKKIVGIVIGIIVLIVVSVMLFIKNVYIFNSTSNSILGFDHITGTITIPSEEHDWGQCISRNDCIQISEYIEKYIKNKYKLNVKVDEIKVSDSRNSAMGIASMGWSPAIIGASMSINFEENDYISSLHDSSNVGGLFCVENMNVSFKTVSREKNVAFSQKIEEYMKQEYAETLEVKEIDISDYGTYYRYNISFTNGSWAEFKSSNYQLMGTMVSIENCDFNNISRDKNIEFSEKVEKNIEQNYGVKLEITAIDFSIRNKSHNYWYKVTFSDGSTKRYDSYSNELFADIELDSGWRLYILREKNVEFSEKIEEYMKQKYNKEFKIEYIEVEANSGGLEYIFRLDKTSDWARMTSSNNKLFEIDELIVELREV